MSKFMRFVAAIVGGVLLTLAFPDFGVWPLAFVSVIVLWFALRGATAWGGFFLGWAYGIVFFAPLLWWAYVAVGPIPWAALSIVEALAFALFGMAWAQIRRSGLLENREWAAAPAFAALWIAVEQLRSMFPFGGFPWGRIAESLVDSPTARFAWLGGIPLAGFVAVLIAALLALVIEFLILRRVLSAALALFVAVVVFFGGIQLPINSEAQDGTIALGIIQGDVPNDGLDSFKQARLVTENHLAGTEALVASEPGPIDLLVWPENAVDLDPRVDAESAAAVTQAAQLAEAPLLFGTVDYTPVEGRYNTSILWSENGTVMDTYSKQRPAPFAEYIPIREVARIFSPAVDRVTQDVIPGVGVATIDVPVERTGSTVRVSTVICFEVAYDQIVRDSVADGAQIIIVQTNNASFGLTAESTQQLAMTRLRAIETGRVAVQASTVGVSAVVDPRGRVMQETGLFTAEQMYAEAALRTEITPAVRFGPVFYWGFLIAPWLIVAFATRRRLATKYEW
ncbi:apolipoprotein N-acyltransferase [Demequina aurantiaca]|uniref:apolipoprotein N-acyltransferase n=1 Tax=Demequina aurantiaca TaxID=676200 RepID=UPI003D34EBEF